MLSELRTDGVGQYSDGRREQEKNMKYGLKRIDLQSALRRQVIKRHPGRGILGRDPSGNVYVTTCQGQWADWSLLQVLLGHRGDSKCHVCAARLEQLMLWGSEQDGLLADSRIYLPVS